MMMRKRPLAKRARKRQPTRAGSSARNVSLVVTIDGPAGCGKSTVAKQMALALGLMYLDTGATYRTLALAALQEEPPVVADALRAGALARQLPIRLEKRGDGSLQVWLGDDDVTEKIRTERVTEAAAQISQYPEVRAAMVVRQRELARRCGEVDGVPRPGSGRRPERSRGSTPLTTIPSARSASRDRTGGVVVEGRDTGSVVFPDATHKFFLDADPAVRAERRQQELEKRYHSKTPLAMVREQIDLRDGLDRSRVVGPLITPKGAVVIDTTHLTVRQVQQRMLAAIRAPRGRVPAGRGRRGKVAGVS